MKTKVKNLVATLLMGATVNAYSAPIFNLFELEIQQNADAQYDAVGKFNIETSIAEEDGTLAMYSVKQINNPQMAYMVEIYQNEAAYQQHLQSAQYQNFINASPEILTAHKKQIKLTPHFLGDKWVQQTAQTRTNLVIVEVLPEFNQAFADVVLPEMQQSLAVEEGVLAMYAGSEVDQPNRWYFFEIYQSDEAYQLHRQSPHFQDYLRQSEAMLSDKQRIEIKASLLGNKGGLNYVYF